MSKHDVPYVVLMSIGGVLLLAGAAFLIYLAIKHRDFKKRIKQIGETAEESIGNDLRVWAKQTNNVFIPGGLYKYDENKVFEVDGVLVTSKAFYVIEIKSIKGGIKGDADGAQWEKVLGDQVFPIGNPITQNEKHIEHFTRMMNMKVPTISLIIFSDRVFFIDIKNTPSHVMVIKHSDLFDSLDSVEASLGIKLDDYEMKTLAAAIKKGRTNKKADIKLHKNITTKGRA